MISPAADFGYAWDAFVPYMLNSLRMVIPATIGSSLLGAVNGYLLSKWKFRGSDVLFSLVLFGMFIPYQSILVPLIETLQRFGLYGKWYGLTIVHIIYGIPITTLIFRNYFANIPNELIEAARIDGAGVIKIFWQIMLPLGLPAFVVVGIFQFTNIWNDFLFGVTVVFSPSAQPVTVALNNLQGTQSVDWTVVMAGAAIAAAPTHDHLHAARQVLHPGPAGGIDEGMSRSYDIVIIGTGMGGGTLARALKDAG